MYFFFFFFFLKDVFSNQGDLLRNYQGNIDSQAEGTNFFKTPIPSLFSGFTTAWHSTAARSGRRQGHTDPHPVNCDDQLRRSMNSPDLNIDLERGTLNLL